MSLCLLFHDVFLFFPPSRPAVWEVHCELLQLDETDTAVWGVQAQEKQGRLVVKSFFGSKFIQINVTAPSKSNRLGVPWRIHHTLRHCVPAPQLLISTAIFWGINFENPSITVESGRNGVTCGGFVKVHPDACFCSERSQMKNWRRFEIRSSTFWKSVYKCGAPTQWRTGTVSGSVKTHPHDCFCSKRSHLLMDFQK